MAVAFVNSSQSIEAPTVGNTTTVSSYSAGGGSDRVLIAISCMRNDSPDRDPANTTIAMGAANFTMFLEEFGPGGNNDPAYAVGRLMDADIPGSATDIVASLDYGNDVSSLFILEFSGVDQTTPIGGSGTYQASSLSTGSDFNVDLVVGQDGSVIITSGGTDSNANDTITFDADPVSEPDPTFTTVHNGGVGTMRVAVGYTGTVNADTYNNLPGQKGGSGNARVAAVAFELREAAAGGGLSIPVAMHNYRRRRAA